MQSGSKKTSLRGAEWRGVGHFRGKARGREGAAQKVPPTGAHRELTIQSLTTRLLERRSDAHGRACRAGTAPFVPEPVMLTQTAALRGAAPSLDRC